MSDNSLLLKGSRVIISPAIRESFLHDLYEDHPGIIKCQLTAKTEIHWPSINKDIKDYMKWCPTYIRLSPTPPAEPLLNHYVPQGLWKKGADFMDC